MALSEVTVTFNLHQALGSDFDARRARAYVKFNVADQTLRDTSTGEIRLGDEKVTINDDGTGSFTTWAPGPDGNPASWQTYLVVEYPRTGQRDRQVKTFGPWTITASGTLALLDEEQAVPAEYLTQVTAQLDTYVTEAEAARDAAVDISNIAVPDDVVSTLIEGTGGAGPLTRSALSASIDARAAYTAAVRFVGGDGSNSNAGRTPGLPFRSIQAAIDDLPNGGKIIVLPSSSDTYEPFAHSGAKLDIEGWGGRGQDTQTGLGLVRIAVPSGGVGFDMNNGGGVHFQGATLRNLHFVGSAGALAGVRIGNVSDFVLEDIGVSDFDASGWGFDIVGGTASQYGTLRNPQIADCLQGLRVRDHNGLRVFGGMIEHLPTGSSIIPDSIGVQVDDTSDTATFVGVITQFLATCYDLSGENHVVSDARLEAFTDGVIFRSGRGILAPGCRFNNFISGGTGKPVTVAATASRTKINHFNYQSVDPEPVLDLGSNTLRLDGLPFDKFLATTISATANEVACFVPRTTGMADSLKLRYLVFQPGETAVAASSTDYWTVTAKRRGGGSADLQTINSQAGWSTYSQQVIDLQASGGSDQTFAAGDRVHLTLTKTGAPANLLNSSIHGIFVPR